MHAVGCYYSWTDVADEDTCWRVKATLLHVASDYSLPISTWWGKQPEPLNPPANEQGTEGLSKAEVLRIMAASASVARHLVFRQAASTAPVPQATVVPASSEQTQEATAKKDGGGDAAAALAAAPAGWRWRL